MGWLSQFYWSLNHYLKINMNGKKYRNVIKKGDCIAIILNFSFLKVNLAFWYITILFSAQTFE